MNRLPAWMVCLSGVFLTVASITPASLIEDVELRTRTIDEAIMAAYCLIVITCLVVFRRAGRMQTLDEGVIFLVINAVGLIGYELRNSELASWWPTVPGILTAIGLAALSVILILLIVGLEMFILSRLGEWHDRRYPQPVPCCASCVSTEVES